MRVDTLGTVLIQRCNTLVPHVLQVHLVSTECSDCIANSTTGTMYGHNAASVCILGTLDAYVKVAVLA